VNERDRKVDLDTADVLGHSGDSSGRCTHLTGSKGTQNQYIKIILFAACSISLPLIVTRDRLMNLGVFRIQVTVLG
jgi:hypothetical protein